MINNRRFGLSAACAVGLIVLDACSESEHTYEVAPDWFNSALREDRDDLEWCIEQSSFSNSDCIEEYDESREHWEAELTDGDYKKVSESDWSEYLTKQRAAEAARNTPEGQRARMLAARGRVEEREARDNCRLVVRRSHPEMGGLERHRMTNKCLVEWRAENQSR